MSWFNWFLGKGDKDEQKDKRPVDDTRPWVNIVGEENDPDLGVKITLDWNDAFIKFLKQNGYTGITEEELVGKWVNDLHKQMVQTDQSGEYE